MHIWNECRIPNNYSIDRLTGWLPDNLPNLFISSFIHVFIHPFIHLFIYSFIHSLVRSFVRSFIYLVSQSVNHRSFIHLFNYSSFIHLFIHSVVHYWIDVCPDSDHRCPDQRQIRRVKFHHIVKPIRSIAVVVKG